MATLVALLLGLVTAAPVTAKPEYARQEKKSCLHCHTAPKGGRDLLNSMGRYYGSFRKLPGAGALFHPKPRRGPAPEHAWHPERDPARVPLPKTRADREAERVLKARMARWTRSLGAKSCYYCHAEKLPGASVKEQRESRERYETAIRHNEMTTMINRSLGDTKVSCYTCHLGGQGPVTMR